MNSRFFIKIRRDVVAEIDRITRYRSGSGFNNAHECIGSSRRVTLFEHFKEVVAGFREALLIYGCHRICKEKARGRDCGRWLSATSRPRIIYTSDPTTEG